MARIVIYDPSDVTVANRVTNYLLSANTPDYDGEPNKLVNPDLSSLSAVPQKHWKYDGASDIIEMNQTEKDDIDAWLDSLASKEPSYDSDGNQIVVIDGGTTQVGMQAVQVLNLPDLSSDLVKSWQITTPTEATEILDIFIGGDLVGPNGECYLSGGEYRCRTSAVEGSALHFEIVDRDDVLGLFSTYGLNRTKLSTLTGFSGGTIDDVNVGEFARGATSDSVAEILAKGADYLEIRFEEPDFTDSETLNFEDSAGTPTGVSCTLGTWDEGDVIVAQTSVKDEWIEGMDIRDVHPGGSKKVPEGMYFRVKVYNADDTNPLRIKVSMTVGRL